MEDITCNRHSAITGGQPGCPDDVLVDCSPLSVFIPLLVAFELCSLYRQPHKLANGFLKLLLLLPVVHHHQRMGRLFPPLHEVMVDQSTANLGVWESARFRLSVKSA